MTGGVYEKLGAHIESTSIGKHAEINSPARPFNADEVKKLQEQLQAFYDQFVEKVADVAAQHAGEDRRARAGPGLDRAAGARRTAWSTRSAGSTARSRSPRSARRSRPTATSSWWSIPPRKSFYELLREQFERVGERCSRGGAGG